MGLKVFIKGIGDVKFPDGVSEEQALEAVRRGVRDGSLETAAGLPMDPQSKAARAEMWGGEDTWYSGTTHDISRFDAARAYEQSDWGQGVYASNNTVDVSDNYAGTQGPDLRGRIVSETENWAQSYADDDWMLENDLEQLAEDPAFIQFLEDAELTPQELTDEIAGGNYDTAIEMLSEYQAESNLIGENQGVMYPLKINQENYAQIGGENPTILREKDYHAEAADELDKADYDTVDDYDEAVQERAYELQDMDDESIYARVNDALYRAGVDDQGRQAVLENLTLEDGELEVGWLDQLIRNNDIWAEGNEGPLHGGPVSGLVLKELGFEGVVDNTVGNKFPSMSGMDQDTRHIITFPGNENRIRSPYAKFDPARAKSRDILASAAGAGVIGAAATGSEEAEAKIPVSRFVKGAEVDPRFDPRVKEQGRIQNLRTESETFLPEVDEVKLGDYEGRGVITGMADRTAAAEILKKINEVELRDPIDLRGGQDYMFDPRRLGQVWASAPAPVKQIVRLAQEMKRKTGKDPLWMPWVMAPSGGDFATMTGEAMLGYANSAMSKAEKRALDKAIKNFKTVGSMKDGKRVGAGLKLDWPGLDSGPAAVKAFQEAPDSLRKELKKMLDVQFRDKGGLNYGEARLAVTDPKQRDAPVGSTMNIGEIAADSPIIDVSGHIDYPMGVPGQGVGRLAEGNRPLITDVLRGGEGATRYEGAVGDFVTDDWVNNKGLPPGELDNRTRRSLEMKPYGTILDEQTLRGLQDMGYETGSADPRLLAGLAGAGALGAAALAPEEAEAGRLQRAAELGFNRDLYHGTLAPDITEFDPNRVDVGTHLGTAEQASKRVDKLASDREFELKYPEMANRNEYGDAPDDLAPNILPLKYRQGKTLRMEDVGRWDNSRQVLAEMQGLDDPALSQWAKQLSDEVNEAALEYDFEDMQTWVESPENREFLDEINTRLRDEGYNTIAYRNQVENTGGSRASMTPEEWQINDAAGSELSAIDEAARARIPDPRRDALDAAMQNPDVTPEQIEQIMQQDWPERVMQYTPEEEARIAQLTAERQKIADAVEARSDSFIALDPADIRSTNAAFDPAKRSSADLLASAAGAGLLGMGALAPEEAEAAKYRAFRGEHGAQADAAENFQTRLGALSFGDAETANHYATSPNVSSDVPVQPRVYPSNLQIDNPVINNPQDPFLPFSDLEKAVGFDHAKKVFNDLSDLNESEYVDEMLEDYGVDSIDQLPDDALRQLDVPAFEVFNDPETVQMMKNNGYDGGITAGYGDNFDQVEYRPFDESQVTPAFGAHPPNAMGQDNAWREPPTIIPDDGKYVPAAAGAATLGAAALAPEEAEARAPFTPDQSMPIGMGPARSPEAQRAQEMNTRIRAAQQQQAQEARTFAQDMQGLGVTAELLGRSMGGMALGGLKAIWDLAGGATYSDAVRGIDEMTAMAMEGMELTPEMMQNMQYIMEATGENARMVLGDPAVDLYNTGFQRAADAAAQKGQELGFPRAGAAAGAALQGLEMFSPI